MALNSDKPEINVVTVRGIYFTPFRRGEHRQSNIVPFPLDIIMGAYYVECRRMRGGGGELVGYFDITP